MTVDRITRVNELLRREIGEALYKVLSDTEIDMSAITVTHVVTGRDLRTARVLVSIRDPQRGEGILKLVRRRRKEIQDLINRDLQLRYTPKLSFELDTSLVRGDRVLDIIAEIEKEMDATQGDGGAHAGETDGTQQDEGEQGT